MARSRYSRRRFLRALALRGGAVALGAGLGKGVMSAAKPYPVSDHCDGRRFFNPRNQVSRTWGDVLQWRRTSERVEWPAWVEVAPRKPPPAPRVGEEPTVTWINHCTFLVRSARLTVLTDPIYSAQASPVSWAGPKRVHAPGVAFEELPRADVVFVSHDHYDHMDLPTLKRIDKRDTPAFLVPLGNRGLLRSIGVPSRRIVELDWWETYSTGGEAAGGAAAGGGPVFTLTPARHWSNRVTGVRNGRLWGGLHLRLDGGSVQFVGDTGYDDLMFKEVRERLGPVDVALIPIGDYEPRWFMEPMHCNPAESLLIHRDLGARRSVAMHWGTFQLADGTREMPVEDLVAAREELGVSAGEFVVLAPGETLRATS